jgi:methylthioribulose-1-phosphate dehydratase
MTDERLREVAGEIISNVREFAAAGWTPATSSNFSRRLDDRCAAITVSGRDKGKLTEADIMVIDFDGKAVGSDHKPSAETLLHTQLYKRFPGSAACCTRIRRRRPSPRACLRRRPRPLEVTNCSRRSRQHHPRHRIDIPVLPNTQDMHTLAAQVDVLLDSECMWGYLIDGHGLYAWGRDMQRRAGTWRRSSSCSDANWN